jgi:GTP-binding protein EngB required for normal cell division
VNDNHRRHLVAILQHIDDLLAETEVKLAPLEAARLLPPCIPDAAPVQRKLIRDYAQRVRAAMRSALERFGVARRPPDVSGVWAARTTLMLAQIAVAELAPQHIRGYGPLDEDTERDIKATVAELSELLGQMESYLAQGAGDSLRARLQRLETGATQGALLLELERIVTAHGLVQFRPALENLAERSASGVLEVAVFGRVNSGKSSLLNYLLKTAALPVGVTPVTALPVRIVYGTQPWGQVSFADAVPQRFALDRLAEFVSEHQNPSNLRHVTSLAVEIPAALLEAGIALVDTPGVGSMRLDATAETWAYLPRCDLGLVLVDAASSLDAMDLELVDALHHNGAESMVLLSKADLLADQELELALSFIRQESATQLHAAIPVYPISVRGSAAALCDRWLEATLVPRLQDRRALADRALARKLDLLREAVRATLERRLSRATGGTDTMQQGRRQEIERLLGQALAGLDRARHERPDEIARLANGAHEALDSAAQHAAVIWNESRESRSDLTGLVESSVRGRAGAAAAAVARSLADLRTVLRATLAEARGRALALPDLAWEPGEELPRAAGMPVLDATSVVPPTVLRRPVLAFAGTTAFKRGILGRLESAGLERRHDRDLDPGRAVAGAGPAGHAAVDLAARGHGAVGDRRRHHRPAHHRRRLGGALLAGDATWIKFLAGAGAILLTFLAGAELDPVVFRRSGSRPRPSGW